jgi:hypothetical protein
MRKQDKLEQGMQDSEIRRQTQVRGSMGTPPSGSDRKVTPDSDVFKERMRGSDTSESERRQRQPGRMPLPD